MCRLSSIINPSEENAFIINGVETLTVQELHSSTPHLPDIARCPLAMDGMDVEGRCAGEIMEGGSSSSALAILQGEDAAMPRNVSGHR